MVKQINKILILFPLIFMGLYTLAFGIEGTTGLIPHIVIPESVYEFGSVVAGADIRHDFILENHGEGVLEIRSVKPD